MIRVSIYVKFRAFGITFGTFKKAYAIGYDGERITWREIPFELEPESARVVVNERGVRLAVW